MHCHEILKILPVGTTPFHPYSYSQRGGMPGGGGGRVEEGGGEEIVAIFLWRAHKKIETVFHFHPTWLNNSLILGEDCRVNLKGFMGKFKKLKNNVVALNCLTFRIWIHHFQLDRDKFWRAFWVRVFLSYDFICVLSDVYLFWFKNALAHLVSLRTYPEL